MSSGKDKNGTSSLSAMMIFRRIGWMVLAGSWLVLIASLVSYSPMDYPSHVAAPANDPPANWCGQVGAAISYRVYLMFGAGAWVLVAAAAAYLFTTVVGRSIDQLGLRAAGVVVLAVTTSSFLALFVNGLSTMPEGAGGLLAIFAVGELTERFNTVGTTLILMMAFGVGATLAADRLVLALPRAMMALGRRIAAINWPRPVLIGRLPSLALALPRLMGRGKAEPASEPTFSPNARGSAARRARKRAAEAEDADEDRIDEAAGGVGATESFDPETSRRQPSEDPDAELTDEEEELAAEAEDEDVEEATDDRDAPQQAQAEKQSLDADAIREKIKKLPISFAAKQKPSPSPVAAQQDLSGYRFPEPTLLAEPESNFTEEMARIVREQAETLERALQTYKIDAEVVAIDAGPVITLYEVKPAPGTKVSQLNAISSDVARELRAPNIRIVPNTAGKTTIGIEVPNLKKEKVRLKELMGLGGHDIFDKMAMPMFLGKDASGDPLIADLAAMPHMLIAGTTGSGKSICINSIIMSFLFARRPDELKLVLVDPKMVEMAQFRDIPHLMCPVVTEMGKASAILEWAVTKMDERYELLAEAGVRDVSGYNSLEWEELKERFDPQSEEEEAAIPKKLPRLVFVIDELADLMMTNKEVEGFIVRIAQKARAVGIHLILATQRPQANVVTGLIKSNMPCRVAFKVASGMDSRIVLDQKGAELLLGQGDMLFLSPRTSKLVRAQGTLVDDFEVRQCVKFLKSVADQSFEPQLVQIRNGGTGEDDPAERDPLFEQAVDVIIETKRGSVSLLQRRLAVGYSRASRLIEQMANAGIIGEYKGSQAREVNITQEDWEAMKAAAAQYEGEDPALAETDYPREIDTGEDDEDDDEALDDFDTEDPEAQLAAEAADEVAEAEVDTDEEVEEEADEADEDEEYVYEAVEDDLDPEQELETLAGDEEEDDEEEYEEYEYEEEEEGEDEDEGDEPRRA